MVILPLIAANAAAGACSNEQGAQLRPEVVDERDGQKYPVAVIGNRRWLGRNLNYAAPSSWCYGDEAAACVDEVRLYTWQAATSACPKGWRLPLDDDWLDLVNEAGGYYILAERRAIGDPTRSYRAL